MRLMILFLTMIIGTLTACACGGDDRTSDGNRTNSGSVNGGAGGDTGFHSTGGSPVGDESGTAGKGGTGPIGKGPGWLYRLDHWKDIHIEGESKFDVLSEANVKSLNLPSAQWDQECGPSCERFKFNRDYEALVAYTLIGSARGKNGPEAFVFSREYPRESQLRLWRVQSLTDGKLNGLLRLKPVTNANKGSYFGKGASPNFVLVHTEEGRGLRGAIDLTSGKWEWKAPYTEDVWGSGCDFLVAGSSPPALIETCLSGIAIRDEPGLAAPTFVTHEISSWWGAAYGRHAVWTHVPVGSTEGNAWIWSREKGHRIAATLPGNLCAIHISDSRIVGAVGGDPLSGGLCDDALADQRLFRMDHDGGSLAWSPVFAEPILLFVAAATDEYAAVLGSREMEEGVYERFYLLVRLSDWSLRRFHSRPGRFSEKQHMALDQNYFYFADFERWTKEDPDFQLRRYPLSQFEEIGEEFVPWAEGD